MAMINLKTKRCFPNKSNWKNVRAYLNCKRPLSEGGVKVYGWVVEDLNNIREIKKPGFTFSSEGPPGSHSYNQEEMFQ